MATITAAGNDPHRCLRAPLQAPAAEEGGQGDAARDSGDRYSRGACQRTSRHQREAGAKVNTTKNAELLEAVRVRLRAGDSMADAARRLGVSDGVVRGLIRRHGRGRRPAPEPAAPTPAVVLHTPREGGCCFPLNDGRPWAFCAEPRLPERLYCARHQRVAFQRSGAAHRAAGQLIGGVDKQIQRSRPSASR